MNDTCYSFGFYRDADTKIFPFIDAINQSEIPLIQNIKLEKVPFMYEKNEEIELPLHDAEKNIFGIAVPSENTYIVQVKGQNVDKLVFNGHHTEIVDENEVRFEIKSRGNEVLINAKNNSNYGTKINYIKITEKDSFNVYIDLKKYAAL